MLIGARYFIMVNAQHWKYEFDARTPRKLKIINYLAEILTVAKVFLWQYFSIIGVFIYVECTPQWNMYLVQGPDKSPKFQIHLSTVCRKDTLQ